MSNEDYVKISAIMRARTKSAVLLEVDGQTCWTPRSVISWSSDQRVTKGQIDDEIEIDIMEWKAEQNGFI